MIALSDFVKNDLIETYKLPAEKISVIGLAAPILDGHGRVAGACAIGGPTDRVRPRLRTLANEVKATARALSVRLGHRAVDARKAGRTS